MEEITTQDTPVEPTKAQKTKKVLADIGAKLATGILVSVTVTVVSAVVSAAILKEIMPKDD